MLISAPVLCTHFCKASLLGLVPELEALGGAVLLLSLTTRHPWGHTLPWLEMVPSHRVSGKPSSNADALGYIGLLRGRPLHYQRTG